MPIIFILLCHLIYLRCPTSPVIPLRSHQKRLIAVCAWGRAMHIFCSGHSALLGTQQISLSVCFG